MGKDNEKYPIEVALEKFFNRIGLGFGKLIWFVTHIPDGKEKRKYWMFDILAITFNVLAIASIVVAIILRAR